MKTQRKNTVMNILGKPPKAETMMCSFRCDRELWADFGVYCTLMKIDKTEVLISYIEELVERERERIELAKQLRG